MQSTMRKALRAVVALCTLGWVLAFALPSGAATTGNDGCGYASSSFTESTVMRWAQINGTGLSSQFIAYGNDEKGLLLGVNGATPLASSPTNGSNGETGAVSHHASAASGGDPAPTDPSGRPFYPALYITNLTAHPLNADGTAAGDFQNGGTPRNLAAGKPFVDDIFGSWTTATISGGNYTDTPPPAQNHWNLGVGSDTPVGTTFSAMGDEGYGAEVRWNVNELTDSDNQALQPGNTYRIQIIEHDGDQNKTGGDAGEFCATLTIPKASPALKTQATSGTVGGTIQDAAILSGGANPTGTITWKLYGPGDSTCQTPIKTFTDSNVNGNGTYNSPTFTPTTAGTYRWIASYSGDAGNLSTAGSCNDANESSTVGPASPSIATVASSTTIGGSISDQAILSGGVNPTGTITWKLYGPTSSSTPSCSTLVQTFTNSNVSGNGTYTSPSFTPSSAGFYFWVASYSGDNNNNPAAGACGDANETSTVHHAGPAISTVASSTTIGGSISDQAMLSGGVNPTGTITWKLYGPASSANNPTCSTVIKTFSANVTGNGTYTSPSFTPSSAGFYFWVASYSGDANNVAASGSCGDTNETSTVSPASPSIATVASSTTIGGTISDQAILSGGVNPTGTITWKLYGPFGSNTPSCSSAIQTFTATVTGNGTYTSPSFTPPMAGFYFWVASYSGDTNNSAASGGCGDANETSQVHHATPSIDTVASSTTIGGSISDQATLSGGFNPTGSITWKLYGPSSSANNPTCSSALRTFSANVSGNGTYTSPSFTPSSAGFYFWVASYSGDSNNDPVSGSCGDSNETSTVSPAAPSIATVASSTTIGGSISDQAILSGGNNPTGSITWILYGPTNSNAPSCSTQVQSFTDNNVSGDGTYTSPSFTPSATGFYFWVASYSGDTNNKAVSGSCGDANETSTVHHASPKIATVASSANAGGSISDQAILSGGVNPTGSITWNLYGPSASANNPSCVTSIKSFSAPVSGNGTYTSPSFTPSAAGFYFWVASYSGDANNLAVSGSCGDANETSTVSSLTPVLKTNATSATLGQPIHDVAHLTGGSNPTGTISWNVYASSDTGCTTPLNTSAISVPVSGDGDYTSPDFTPASAGSYQWVATYSGDANNNSVSTACGDPNEVSRVTKNAAPAITLQKVQRIGSSGSFTHGDVTGNVGATDNYEMFVMNTGNTTLVISFSDPGCDPGTLSGPSVVSGTYDGSTRTLSAGGELKYTCSHSVLASDQPFVNTASVTGTPPSGPPVSATDHVRNFANVPGMRVVKLQRDGTSGPFTSGQITASVGDTIYYEIQVTNTGNTSLTLSLNDPHCDAGTIQGPFAISGTLIGNTLSKGGEAQYTCSHVVTSTDIPQYTNTATVTGRPPSGPPVHGTGIVTANVTKAAIQVLKLEKVAGSSGGFTTGPITVDTGTTTHYVVHTIDYEIQVTNTGNVPLTLSLNDPRCDAGTIQGPAVITGTLSGDVLSPGGQAQYTCSHRLLKGDPGSFTNTATVTGTPPSGPPVSGHSSVTVNKRTHVKHLKACRSVTTGRIIHYSGNRKPKACRPQKPHKPNGFTG